MVDEYETYPKLPQIWHSVYPLLFTILKLHITRAQTIIYASMIL